MRLNKSRIALIAAATLAPIAAMATPPWFIDWAHTAPFEKVLLRIYYLSNENGTSRSQSLPRVQIAYGLTYNLELNIRNEDLEKTSTKQTVIGVNDTVVGMKWRFKGEETKNNLALGYAYTVRTGVTGISGNTNSQTPYLMASVYQGRFGFYPEVGETFPDSHAIHEDAYYGMLTSYKLNGPWLLMAEGYGNTATTSGAKNDIEYAGGFYYQPTPLVRYFARVGHSVEGYSDLQMTFGIQMQLN